MVGEDVVAEGGAVEVDVDLGGGDAFVAEHLLDGAEVCSAFEQVGGERVAQGMGRDCLADSGRGCEVFDYLENAVAGEASATAVEEEDVAAVGLDVHVRPL